ncbi:MAG: hypothetical protein IPK14_24165 [Blastocatellia bacterium]|nr:hypothetical protein [Blastocatellia bacterium]
MKKVLIRKISFLVIFLVICFQNTSLAQETPTKKISPILTNEAFTTSPTNSNNPTSTVTENPVNLADKQNQEKPNDKQNQVIDPSLQFKVLDLMLALAEDPENQVLRMQQIELNTQVRQAKLVKVSETNLRDLEFRKKYISLRVAIINAQRQQQNAIASVQQQRRKIVQGGQGNGAFTGVFQAQAQVEALEKEITKLKLELDILITEGRRLGVGTRVFR